MIVKYETFAKTHLNVMPRHCIFTYDELCYTYEPALKILVLIPLSRNNGSGESAQTCQSLCCLHAQNMDVAGYPD